MTTQHGFARVAAAFVASAVLVGGSIGAHAESTSGSITIRGAGATFPAPLYAKWIDSFEKQNAGVAIVYDAVGSGEGTSRFVGGGIDFGASDAALSDTDMARIPQGAVVVPATAGMIVLAYNVEGITGELKLPRDVYVGILAGEITSWDDPRLRDANPRISLPHRTIALVARLDSSGTTYALTRHLAAVGGAWGARGLGYGKMVDWPAGTMFARGNEGVAARIKISADSIGYVEYGFAKRLGLPMASLQNRAGHYIRPEEEAGKIALEHASSGEAADLRQFDPDPDGVDSYGLVTYSWLLLYKRYNDAQRRDAVKEFVQWGLTAGQSFSNSLGYLPLPAAVSSRSQQVIDTIQ
ncbi:MAG: phosphate ABC transporter substrate-binding protein PstS [Rhodospirillales bacterium]|nr:phosphate ABC transporter substrate-binding protein PstS [Rhodospirillales bacterium]